MRQNRKGHCSAPDCAARIYAKRLCVSHWKKARYVPKPRPSIVDTFDQQYAEDSNGCLVWLRARAGKEAAKGGGYGCFKIGNKAVRASGDMGYVTVPATLLAVRGVGATLAKRIQEELSK